MRPVAPSLLRFTSTAAVVAVALFAAGPARSQADPAAEKRYSIHGYGEIHYNNPEGGTMDEDAPARVDVETNGRSLRMRVAHM